VSAKGHSILVVDDEESMRELLEILLGNDGYNVVVASNVDEALDRLGEQTFDCVLTDLRMGSEREAGMRLLGWVQENAAGTPAVMMTAYGSVETAIQAIKRGAADYIMKPFKNDEIRMNVQRAIEQRDLLRENMAFRKAQAQSGSIDNIIGQSAPINEVREMIRRVAQLPSTVAIHGESGTGKELVARAIHQLSDRAQKPFVAINCGGIPETLLESELFGHKKGAFTGAHDDKEGLFVVADGGTLFLDEIGEMPLSLQVKLLRVLDNSEVMPVGGTSGHKVDVRILSATNRNLEEMSKEGDFREDLYYRLNVIPITVPPLRDRADDIPLLAKFFAGAHAEKMGRGDLAIAPDAEQGLRAYHWPGNVRELGNVMERAVALCGSEAIDISDLPQNVQNHVSTSEAKDLSKLPVGGVDLEELIAGIEINLIEQALKNSKFSQKKAAELLGLTSRSLRYRLKKYNLESQ
jgi:two-component system response regulator PilR (NtrC family)